MHRHVKSTLTAVTVALLLPWFAQTPASAASGYAQTAPGENVSLNSLPGAGEDNLDYIFDRFVTWEDDGNFYFDMEAARSAGVDDFALRVGNQFNAIVSQQNLLGTYAEVLRAPLVDRWAYCGAGNSGPGNPYNSADAVCQRHDYCISAAAGDRQRMIDCDNRFINEMNAVKGSYSGSDRVYIEAAIQVIRAARACRPHC